MLKGPWYSHWSCGTGTLYMCMEVLRVTSHNKFPTRFTRKTAMWGGGASVEVLTVVALCVVVNMNVANVTGLSPTM